MEGFRSTIVVVVPVGVEILAGSRVVVVGVVVTTNIRSKCPWQLLII